MRSNINGYSCIVLDFLNATSSFDETISGDFSIIKAYSFGSMFGLLKTHIFNVALICLPVSDFEDSVSRLSDLKKVLSVPLIMVLDHADLEIARLCGRIGFDNVICTANIRLLPEILLRIRNSSDTMVKLRDLSIVPDFSSPLVNNLLLFIEKNYLTISGVSELASAFRIHENTVIREFRKYLLPSPKQLLLKFKIFHSINIMKHNRLTIKEIACNSGFKDSKSLIRSFYKFYDCSPNVYYREKIKKFQLVL